MPASLDIVLPCYNPPAEWAEGVVTCYGRIVEAIGARPGLIIVNDGSSHGVLQSDLDLIRAAIPEFVYLRNEENRGKGFTLRKGVAVSEAELCIYTDIDFPYEEASLLEVYHMLYSEASIVAGIKGPHYYRNVPVFRRRISMLLRRLIRFFLSMDITDTQCGLKGFDRKGRRLFLATTIDRYLFDLEFLFIASRENGVNVRTTEVRLKDRVIFTRMPPRMLMTEGLNFLKVWRRSLHD